MSAEDAPELVDPLEQHRIDAGALADWLSPHVPGADNHRIRSGAIRMIFEGAIPRFSDFVIVRAVVADVKAIAEAWLESSRVWLKFYHWCSRSNLM